MPLWWGVRARSCQARDIQVQPTFAKIKLNGVGSCEVSEPFLSRKDFDRFLVPGRNMQNVSDGSILRRFEICSDHLRSSQIISDHLRSSQIIRVASVLHPFSTSLSQRWDRRSGHAREIFLWRCDAEQKKDRRETKRTGECEIISMAFLCLNLSQFISICM